MSENIIYTPMEIKAARALNKQMAEECQIDEQDQWNLHAEEMKAIARVTLEACGANDSLDALTDLREAVKSKGIISTVKALAKTDKAIAKATK